MEAQVLRGKAVPLRVPDEVLETTGLMPTIARIEEGGRYKVRVHDASLGRGYPVIMTTIVDRIRSSIGVKFGAHPSLPVAVERTLTEAFQGRSVDDGTSTNRLTSLAESANPRNISNLYINNLGVFPTTTFCREPTWDFAPWPSWQGKTNAQMLSYMRAVLRRDGYHMLVRDASHLGFPSCQILVPGMSETFVPAGDLRKGLLSTIRAKEVLRRFPTLSKEEQHELLALKPHDIAHAHPDMFGLPFVGARMHPCRVYGFLHLTLGEFSEAQECFGVLAQLVEGVGSYFWRAMADFAGWRADAVQRDRRPSSLLCGFGLAQRFQLAVQRVSVAHELELDHSQRSLNARAFSLRTCQRARSLNARSIPPPFGTLNSGGTEHVQELGAELGRVALEVLAHGVEHRFTRGHHVVADLLLLVQAVALRRVQADIRLEVRHFLGLPKLFPLGIVRHVGPSFLCYRAPRGLLAVKNSVKRNPQRSVFFRCEVKGDLRSDLRFCCKVG